MLPGAEVTRTATVAGVVPLGHLNASVIVNPVSSEGLLPTASRSGSLWAAPWVYLAILAVLVALIAGAIWMRRRRAFVAPSPWPV